VAKRGSWSILISSLGVFLMTNTWSAIVASNLPCYFIPTLSFLGLLIDSAFNRERCPFFFFVFIVAQQYAQIAETNFQIPSGKSEIKPLKDKLHEWIWNNRQHLHHGLISYSKLAALGVALLSSFFWVSSPTSYSLSIQHSILQ
jgi:hypothetical protein